MANMSYCRFRNTRLALIDCVSELEYIRDGESEKPSEEELLAMNSMYGWCNDFIELYDELKEDNLL